MKREYLYGIIGLLGGILLAIFFATNAVNSNDTSMMNMMGMRSINNSNMMDSDDMHKMSDGSMMRNMDSGMSMEDMVNGLKGKTGDEFDKAFIFDMIEHHQGAIDMAKLAKQYAGHDALKAMADDIISAQSKEITQMQSWQKEWGY